MTAPWMPPLPEPDVIVHYTADQMRQALAIGWPAGARVPRVEP